MLSVDSSRLCMSGLSLCDLCLCYSILGSQFSNKYLHAGLLRCGGLDTLGPVSTGMGDRSWRLSHVRTILVFVFND